jgi:hypothetical protein
MKTSAKIGLKALRSVAGTHSAVEQRLRHGVNRARFAYRGTLHRRDAYVFRGDRRERARLGIYAFGACDLWAVVYSGPPLSERFGGTGCVLKLGTAASSRSDVLLQTLDPDVSAAAAPVLRRLDLPASYFLPELFNPTFSVPGHHHLGRFAKDVIVLSIAADLSRVVYEHRESGLLVDPGGWWLEQSLDQIRHRLADTKWFAANFRKLGRMDVKTFKANTRRLVREIRMRTGAQVLVLNNLAIEPGRPTPDYRLVPDPQDRRRREFNIALAELSMDEDFSIVDADRVLKGVGTAAQADFIHRTPPQKRAIAYEVVRLLHERGVVA